MVQPTSLLKVSDGTGVSLVRCIKVLGSPKRKRGRVGDRLVVSIKRINPLSKKVKRDRDERIVLYEGLVCRAILIRTRERFSRTPGIFFTFDDNAVVLVDKKDRPFGRKIRGPVLWETCVEHDCVLAMCNIVI